MIENHFQSKKTKHGKRFAYFIAGFIVAGIFILSGCASHRATVSGKFGEALSPSNDEIANIKLNSGERVLARKLQDDKDSLYLVLLDYSFHAISKDSVAEIEIETRPIENSIQEGSFKSQTKSDGTSRENNEGAFAIAAAVGMVGAVIVILLINSFANDLANKFK